jgi:hypothetical protein
MRAAPNAARVAPSFAVLHRSTPVIVTVIPTRTFCLTELLFYYMNI